MSRRLILVAGLAGLFLHPDPAVTRSAAPAALPAAPPAGEPPFRVCFSSDMFVDINRNDARASVSAWAQAVLKQANVNMDSEPMVTENVAEMTAALEHKRVDAVALLAPEYFAIPPGLLAKDRIYINVTDGSPHEKYVILVQAADGVKTLADLGGRDLIVWRHMQTGLLIPWLEVELDRHRLPGIDKFFSRVASSTQLSQVVLPVFFGRSAACLVTRKGFTDMVELNPQIGQKLRVLAESPPLAPGFLCFRAGFDSSYRPRLEQAIQEISATPAGRQLLAVFKGENITSLPLSTLISDERLLRDYTALQKRRSIKTLPFYPRLEQLP